MEAMTRAEFKVRWEKDAEGDGITYDEIADCATAWGLFSIPRIHPLDEVTYAVLKSSGCEDAEDFAPEPGGDEEA